MTERTTGATDAPAAPDSGPTTGATVDQIIAGAERMARAIGVAWERENEESRASWCATVQHFSADLVPPDHRIVPAALMEAVDDLLLVDDVWERIGAIELIRCIRLEMPSFAAAQNGGTV